jgi:hypothetical protein
VVLSSVALLCLTSGGAAWIKQMRILRAFRLFRIFQKMGELQRIILAVTMSIVPTIQAMVGGE